MDTTLEAFYRAIEAQDVARVRAVLDDGVDVNTQDKFGSSPLHYTAIFGHADVVRELLQRGADVHARVNDGETPLHSAAYCGHEEVARLLLDYEADVNAINDSNMTPLHSAALSGRLGVVQLLLERGADIEAKDKKGDTALHYAASKDNVEIVSMLVDRGANVVAASGSGKTPLHEAAQHGCLGAMDAMLARGADIDFPDDHGQTMLHHAARASNIDAMAFLVERGAFTGARDKDNKVSLYYLIHRSLPLAIRLAFDSVRSNFVKGQRLWRQLIESAADIDEVAAIRRCLDLWQQQSDDDADLTEIPAEVAIEGSASVQVYISALTDSSSPTYRHKVCVVGPTTAGKTSLIKSLTRGESTLEEMDTRTVGIDLFSHHFESDGKQHEVTFWDFAGQDVYHAAHTVFFSRRTLFLVVVDLGKYASVLPHANERAQIAEPRIKRFVDEHVLHWMRLILTRLPDATIAFVGTKTDLVAPGIVGEIQVDLEGRVARWCEEQSAVQETYHQKPTTKRHSVSWIDTRKILTAAIQAWLTVSSTDIHSIQATLKRVEHLIISQRRGFLMPDMYLSVLERIRGRRRACGSTLTAQVKSIFVKKQDVLQWLLRMLPMLREQGCKLVMRTLHELGDVLWYDSSQVSAALQDQTCLTPELVINLVREIISHELFELMSGTNAVSDYTPPPDSRQKTYHAIHRDAHFLVWKEKLMGSGCVDDGLIRELPLWSGVAKAKDTHALGALKTLLQHLGLAYPLGDTETMQPNASLIVPAYWKMRDAIEERRDTNDLLTHMLLSTECSALLHEYAWEYEFYASYFPPTLFESVVVRTFAPNTKRVVTTPDRVVIAVADEAVIRLEIVGTHRKKLIRVEAIAVTQELAEKLVLYHCSVVESVLAEYPGLDPIVRSVEGVDSKVNELEEEQRQQLVQKAVNEVVVQEPAMNTTSAPRLPRLSQSSERPIPLCLDLQVVDLSWCDAASRRGRHKPSIDRVTMEWSLSMAGSRINLRQAHAREGQLVIEFRDVPTVPVLKQCELQVVVKRSGLLWSQTVVGLGALRLDRVIPDDSLGVFQVNNVTLPLTLSSRETVIIGHLRCNVACIANHKTAIAA